MSSSSSGSAGVEITYFPVVHLPRSMVRQRSLQNGKVSSPASTSLRQTGQRNERFFFFAMTSENPGHQVVVVRFDDFAAVELARLRLIVIAEIVDEQLSVDFRGVHLGAAFPQQIGLFGRAEGEDIELASHQLCFVLFADALLNLHQLFAAAFDLARRNFILQMMRLRAFLIGVAEDAHPVELRGGNELAQLLEVFFRFTGEADDERKKTSRSCASSL